MELRVDKTLVPYHEAVSFMETCAQDRTELFWILRHFPIYTGGVGALNQTLTPLNQLPFPYYQTKRGGKITFHDEGQLIIYIVCDLVKHALCFKQFLNLIQTVGENILRACGIGCAQGPIPGFWIQMKSGSLKKIGSIGVCIKKGMTYHGIAINHTLNKHAFSVIDPCGLSPDFLVDVKSLNPIMSLDDLYGAGMNEYAQWIMEKTEQDRSKSLLIC